MRIEGCDPLGLQLGPSCPVSNPNLLADLSDALILSNQYLRLTKLVDDLSGRKTFPRLAGLILEAYERIMNG